MFREYSYIHATPHNRASFVRLFWKCYRQIGKKGGICYFRFTLLYRFYFSWLRHHITVVSVFIFKPVKDRIEIFILLLLILSNKNIFFSFYIALFSISWNGNQTFNATYINQFDYRFLTQMFCEERTHSQLNMRAKFLIENHTQF